MAPAIAAAIGVAIISATVAFTLLSYDRLPERIPIHFGIDGVADGFARREAIWLMVGLQLILAATYAVLYASAIGPRGLIFFGVSVLAVCAWGQFHAISAATGGTNRIRVWQFWGGFAAIFISGIVAAIITG
jgi:uncharacterized membrane protein